MNGELRYAGKKAHVLVAVDLGKRKVGVSLGHVEPGVPPLLTCALTVELPLRVTWTPEVMATYVHNAVNYAREVIDMPNTSNRPMRWVCEWPMKYDLGHKYHKDIDDLWAVGNALGVRWAKKYRPGQWKGQVPKRVHHERLMRAFTEAELTALFAFPAQHLGLDPEWILSKDAHDARDAAGIWLYATGRTGRGGTL